MQIEFNVKEKSANDFFSMYKSDFIKDRNNDRIGSAESNPYYLFTDEIILSNKLLEVVKMDAVITFELEDRAMGSRKSLLNIYKYEVKEYDNVSLRLVLIDFSVRAQ